MAMVTSSRMVFQPINGRQTLGKKSQVLRKKMSGEKKFSLQEALDLLQDLPSKSNDALKDDSSAEEVPVNNLLEFSLDS
ncbi:hypothetical protein TNCV_1908631 [Trichonephila clavipes]|nr:hypothetical protein TNCV_1908631 [Trichonephila clavipes]